MKFRQLGFTLIELVMVIVLLGILSIFALPRFANLSGDATSSVFSAVRHNFLTAVQLVHSKSLIHQQGGVFPDIALEGTCINVDPVSGYPTVDQTPASCVAVASIDRLDDWRQPRTSDLRIATRHVFVALLDTIFPPAHALPPPPPTAGPELPSLLLNTDFTGWVWTKTVPSATFTSPDGQSFVYNQNTGGVN